MPAMSSSAISVAWTILSIGLSNAVSPSRNVRRNLGSHRLRVCYFLVFKVAVRACVPRLSQAYGSFLYCGLTWGACLAVWLAPARRTFAVLSVPPKVSPQQSFGWMRSIRLSRARLARLGAMAALHLV